VEKSGLTTRTNSRTGRGVGEIFMILAP